MNDIEKEKRVEEKGIFSKLNIPTLIINVSIFLLIVSVLYIIINLFNSIINLQTNDLYEIISEFLQDMRHVIFSLTFWGIGVIFNNILKRSDNNEE